MAKPLPDNVLAFIEENQPPSELQAGDMTVFDYADAWDCSRQKAERILKKAIKDGKMTTEYRYKPTETGGKKVKIYILKE